MQGASEQSLTPREMVRRGYDAIGERYHAWSHQNETRLRFVHEVLDRLSPGSLVVDLGCGSGDPATRLLSREHAVMGVDISLAQLSIARRLAPRATLVQADIGEFSLRAGSVDAVVSFYATGHIPAAAHGALYAAIGCWLRPGGWLVTSAPLSPGDATKDDWLGVPMFFGGIGPEATLRAVQDAGLVVAQSEIVVEQLRDGSAERFLWISADKRPS